MEKKLGYMEFLPVEELAPAELDTIVGGISITVVGANGR